MCSVFHVSLVPLRSGLLAVFGRYSPLSGHTPLLFVGQKDGSSFWLFWEAEKTTRLSGLKNLTFLVHSRWFSTFLGKHGFFLSPLSGP
jgi:hypothetical protein